MGCFLGLVVAAVSSHDCVANTYTATSAAFSLQSKLLCFLYRTRTWTGSNDPRMCWQSRQLGHFTGQTNGLPARSQQWHASGSQNFESLSPHAGPAGEQCDSPGLRDPRFGKFLIIQRLPSDARDPGLACRYTTRLAHRRIDTTSFGIEALPTYLPRCFFRDGVGRATGNQALALHIPTSLLLRFARHQHRGQDCQSHREYLLHFGILTRKLGQR